MYNKGMEMDIRHPTSDLISPTPAESLWNLQSSSQVEPELPKRSKKLWNFIRHHWLTVAFVLGFVIDNLTLNQVDQFFDNAILAVYVVLAMVSMFVLYAGAAEKLPEAVILPARKYAPFMMQYAFGGLLSGMLIFYGRSGAWVDSWPYLAIILLAIYGNETIRDRSTRLLYNLAILFIGLFSYVVLLVPVISGLMGPWIFVGSGLLALMLMYGFMRLLYLIIPRFIELQMKSIVFILGVVFAGFNFFYFANIIPPIPLSLKDAGVFHSVVKFENGNYQVKYEEGQWWQPFKDSDSTIHPSTGQSIYCYAQVFAPTRITTDIVHVWEYKDPASGKWVERYRLAYVITGGRSDGYRGYTLVNSYQNGKWRCSVETTRGQVLGRELFTIDNTISASSLVVEVK